MPLISQATNQVHLPEPNICCTPEQGCVITGRWEEEEEEEEEEED